MMNARTELSPASRVELHEEHDGRIARIVLANAPDNAIDVTLANELCAALDAIERWPNLVCVLLEGEGTSFSSGLSLGHRRPPIGGELIRSFLAAAQKLSTLEAVQMALVRGPCFGAGLDLALLAHVVLADSTAKFGTADLSLAAIPLLTPLLLPERIGWTRAEEWMLSGRVIAVEEALAAGLVSGSSSGWETLDTLAERYLRATVLFRPTTALRTFVHALSLPRRERLEHDLPEIQRLFEERIATSDNYAEGLSAALHGRPPCWK